MERIRRLFLKEDTNGQYEPLDDTNGRRANATKGSKFGWFEYGIFTLLGIAMLWAWNMFLAAATYFKSRFAGHDDLSNSFQSAEITVSTIANLTTMLVLTKLQKNASYPLRIASSLLINIVCFSLLALFTLTFLDIQAASYYAFLMVMVCFTSMAAGLCQNGVFAYASSFGVGEYTQAIMTGQGIAGVLPPIVKIASALSVPQDASGAIATESPRSACAYFGTAAGVSAVSLLAFGFLLRRNPMHGQVRVHVDDMNAGEEDGTVEEDMTASQMSQRKALGLWQLFLKLKWMALGVAVTFAVTLASFPVFTSKVLSVQDPETSARLFQPAAFVPVGYLMWNIGDFLGRLLPLVPALNLVHRPKTVFTASVLRVLFVPLYLLCNIDGGGAVISSDFFYLFIVQLLFGLTNGWLGSTCMMSTSIWVDDDELEAAGAFMGLMLVGGLTTGSLLSFAVT